MPSHTSTAHPPAFMKHKLARLHMTPQGCNPRHVSSPHTVLRVHTDTGKHTCLCMCAFMRTRTHTLGRVVFRALPFIGRIAAAKRNELSFGQGCFSLALLHTHAHPSTSRAGLAPNALAEGKEGKRAAKRTEGWVPVMGVVARTPPAIKRSPLCPNLSHFPFPTMCFEKGNPSKCVPASSLYGMLGILSPSGKSFPPVTGK